MKAEFDVDIKVKDMYSFLLNNTYRKVSGIIWIIFSLIVAGVTVYTWGDVDISNSVLLIVLACLYTVINPVMLYLKAASQVKRNASFKQLLHYIVDDTGISISQGEEQARVNWDEMWKAVKYGQAVVVYVSNVRAFIFPIRCVGEQYDVLAELTAKGLGSRNHLRKKSS